MDSCTFVKNEAYSRGVVAFTEGQIAMIAFLDSVFIQNSGYRGGLFFGEAGSLISNIDSYFEKNFAFEGGIGYV